MAADTNITSADIVLHPNYPGMEGDFRGAPNVDRTIFLIPYFSQDRLCWCVRPLSSVESLSMYTSQLATPLNYMLLPSPNLQELSTMLYGSCPHYTSVSVSTFVAESLVPHIVNPHYSNVVRCHVIKPLPTVTEWSQAYADDKETNFIIARLKVTTPWKEEETRRVHKGYW